MAYSGASERLSLNRAERSAADDYNRRMTQPGLAFFTDAVEEYLSRVSVVASHTVQ